MDANGIREVSERLRAQIHRVVVGQDSTEV